MQDIPARIARFLAYDSETGALSWTDHPNRITRKRLVGKSVGGPYRGGYFLVRFEGHCYQAARVAFFLGRGRQPVGQIDHADGDATNNRLVNLREASPSQNTANRRGWGRFKKGVRKSGDKFFATHRGQYLGTFLTEDEAHEAYRQSATSTFGEFARFE